MKTRLGGMLAAGVVLGLLTMTLCVYAQQVGQAIESKYDVDRGLPTHGAYSGQVGSATALAHDLKCIITASNFVPGGVRGTFDNRHWHISVTVTIENNWNPPGVDLNSRLTAKLVYTDANGVPQLAESPELKGNGASHTFDLEVTRWGGQVENDNGAWFLYGTLKVIAGQGQSLATAYKVTCSADTPRP